MEMEEGLVGPYQAPEGRRGGERCRGGGGGLDRHDSPRQVCLGEVTGAGAS